MRWLSLLVLALTLLACADEEKKLELGEPCDAHTQCASGLCSIPFPDGGLGDAGTQLTKRCMEPGI